LDTFQYDRIGSDQGVIANRHRHLGTVCIICQDIPAIHVVEAMKIMIENPDIRPDGHVIPDCYVHPCRQDGR